MALVNDYTEADLVRRMNGIYNQETDALGTTDDDYLLMREYLNQAVEDWQDFRDTRWEELKSSTDEDDDGAVLVLATGTSSYAAPTACRQLGSEIFVYNAEGTLFATVPVIKKRDIRKIRRTTTTCRAYLSGKPGARTVVFMNLPAEYDGMTIVYDYDKFATRFDGAATTSECPMPAYLVHQGLSKMHATSRPALAAKHENLALDIIEPMQARNIIETPGTRNYLDNSWSHFDQGGGSFFNG